MPLGSGCRGGPSLRLGGVLLFTAHHRRKDPRLGERGRRISAPAFLEGYPGADGRFWAKVNQTESCWLWVAAQNGVGYGYFWNGEYAVLAHRWAYERFIGPIPRHLELDHLCRLRCCVRPAHLEPVTTRTNLLRGVGASARHARKERCPRGHRYDAVVHRSNGKMYRSCRTCNRDKTRAWREAHQ